MIAGNIIRFSFIYMCASLISVNAYADLKNCQGAQYETLQFPALVNNIQLGYTALNSSEVFSCIVNVIDLSKDSKPEVKLLPVLEAPENSIVLCNYYYTIYSVDRPISVTACKDTSSGDVYLRLLSFLNLN